MINLLPPEVKDEIRYSKRNAVILRYLGLTVLISAILAGTLVGARYYLGKQLSDADASVADKQHQIASYHNLQANAVKINNRLVAIQGVQKSQARFSLLLSDLAQYMPQGTSITSISLTGNDKQPVSMTVQAIDYKTALSFRDSITRSKRIGAADIISIKSDSSTHLYNVTVNFAFNPGKAR